MTTRSSRSPRRRTVVALGVVFAVLVAFGIRLVDIQIVSADQHVKDSLTKIGGTVSLKGTRGAITDVSGTILAQSTVRYDAQFSPVNVTPREITRGGEKVEVPWPETAADISAITGQTAEEVMSIVADALADDPESQFAYLARGLSTEQYRALAELGLPYLSFTSQPSRVYPQGAVAGSLTGFVGVDGTPLEGLELAQDQCLAATDGEETFERGQDGVVIPGTKKETPAVDGGTLRLTVDADLQWYMQQLIAEQVQKFASISGTITVIEAKTGKIRAAAEYPTVDPNEFDAEGSFLRSRIFQDTFEPASTFKALSAAVLVDGAGLTPMTTIEAPWRVEFANGAVVRDMSGHPTYNYTLNGVLVDSSNVGISRLSERIDPATRYEYLKKFGIGQGSAVDFPAAAAGTLYPASQWDNQQLYDTNYGQGVATTIPELMGAYSAIANDGVRVPLRLIESCTKTDGTVVEPDLPEPVRVISEQSAQQVTTMLENVYLQAGYADAIHVPGYRVAMKSGTGQKTDGNGNYKSGVWYTLMIGFAPAEDPEYIVAITLDEPTKVKSSSADAEGFQKAMTQVMKTYRVLPSTTPAATLPVYQ
ncbi:MAG: peptidoglycan D,D-transpeptidase FtsI family protein [Microbacterium sp.]|uniref:peptidoglycan D,D-transpeptidase FtsI family protein n=1 Tax=Microbacterium sp. TaxID=51671 RepID=UPI003A8A2093